MPKNSEYRQPLPLRLLYGLYGSLPLPMLSMALLAVATLLLLCWLSGMFSLQDMPHAGRRERLGMIATLTCVTAYILSLLPYIQSVNAKSIDKIRDLVEQNDHTERYLRQLNRPGRISLVLATIAGLYWALGQNIPLNQFSLQYGSDTFGIEVGTILIQSIMWTVVAIALTVRIHWSVYLFRLGNYARVKLFHLEQLTPFARSGLLDVLFVMGALAFMPLQEFDGNPQFSDYSNGLIVGLSAAVLIMWQSVYCVLKQIVKSKQQRLIQLDLALNNACAQMDTENLNRLNVLLNHKD